MQYRINTFQSRAPAPDRGAFWHLQSSSPAFLDLYTISKRGKVASEAWAQCPVVQVAEMRFKGGIDEPLIVFFGERTHGCDTGGYMRSRRLWSGGILR